MRRVEYAIEDLTMILNNTACLNLVPKKNAAAIKFRPGQYGLISFLRGNVLSAERPFSFASSKLNSESLQFGFRVVGQFTTEVSKLKKGDSVFVRGPYGSFVYNEKKYKDTVFLAAGIGITPFLSAIRYAAEKRLPNKMTLIYANTSAGEIPFYKELRKLEIVNNKLKSYFLVSQPDADLNLRQFIPGRINQSIVWNVLDGKIAGKTFFICGPEPFMVAAVDLLKELGVEDRNIKMEGFSQIPISFFEKGTGIFPLIAGTSALITLAAFISINQIETSKALVKYNEAQLYAQQQATEQQIMPPMAHAQSQDIVTPQPSQVQPVVVQDIPPVVTTPVTPPVQVQAKVPRKTVKKAPVYVAPQVVKTTPVYVAPKVVKPVPVYVPPTPVYTPPPVYYYPPPQTRMS